jgi:hypothetical protein
VSAQIDKEGEGVPCVRGIKGRLTGEGESTAAAGREDEGGCGNGENGRERARVWSGAV